MKKILVLGLILMLMVSGCSGTPEVQYTKYTRSFFDTFDTLVQVVAYTESEEEFDAYAEQIHQRLQELHKLYNIYLSYDGINNMKTINDNAGVEPVVVEQEIIDLVLYGKEWYQRTGETTNIAMGPVLKIWHDYRTEATDDPINAKVPAMEELEKAAQYTDIDQVIVDTEKNTVFLADPNMRLDVGAIAKGFATELVAKEIEAAGMTSGIISPGGNIRVIGKPLDGIRERWSIGIQDPNASIVSDDNILDTVFVEDASVVSSGDYQRYYVVGDQLLHHIIDPKTLMPGAYYRAVTVVSQDSGLADLASTALFLMPFEESYALAESLDGLEAYWVHPDGSVQFTDGLKSMLRSEGATNEKK